MSSRDRAPGRRARRPAGMRIFIAIFLVLHLPLFVYPVLRLGDWLSLSLPTTLLILAPVVSSQMLSRWLLRDSRRPLARLLRRVADFMLGVSPILLMLLLVFELPVLFSVLTGRAAAFWVLGLAGLVSLAGVLVAMAPQVKRVAFESDRLTRPLRFVQITDVHIGSRSSGFLRHIVNRIKSLEPEFVCITGDLVDASGVTTAELAALRELPCPVYFSVGNHERYEDLEDILARLGSLGVKVLRTAAVRHREDVQVLGVDDRDDALQVERELGKLAPDKGAFGILMYHRPRGFEAAAAAGVDLMISGHTHKGQIFPFNLVVNRVFDRIAGMYRHGNARLYVSQGTGTWGPVMRVGTRAEITLFDIGAGA